MDSQVHWYRGNVVSGAVQRLARTAIGTVVGVHTVLLIYTTYGGIWLVPWSILAGVAVTAARLGLSLTTNPLTFDYLRNHLALPYRYVNIGNGDTPLPPIRADWSSPDAEPSEDELAAEQHRCEVGEVLESLGLARRLTVSDIDAHPAPVFDLHQSESEIILAALSAATGSVSLLTRLSDGRILQTGEVAIPPHSSLVVNTVPGADAKTLGSSHLRLMAELAANGIDAVPAQPALFLEMMKLEDRIYAEIGPLIGSLCRLETGAAPHQLSVHVPAGRIRSLGLAHRTSTTAPS